MLKAWFRLSLRSFGVFSSRGILMAFLLMIFSSHPGLARSNSKLSENLESSLNFSLEGKSNKNVQSQSQLIGTNIGLNTNYWLQKNFYLVADLSLSFNTGHIQALETDKKSGVNLLLDQASANYIPYANSRLSAGALSPKTIHSNLLLSDNPFPAGRADINIYSNNTSLINVYLQNAITTNSSLSTNTKELEPTPELRTIGFRLNLGNNVNNINTTLAYFSFNNLSTSIATDSALKGNTTLAISNLERQFVNSFNGIDFQTEGNLELTKRMSASLKLAFLKNQGAEETLNSGYAATLGGKYHLKNHTLGLTGTYFKIEPDATVSTYSSTQYFYTNRVGYTTEAKLDFTKNKFSIKFAFTDAQTIYQSIDQNKEQLFLLKLETTYAHL